MSLRYGSVCSGIEAATTAWHPLGWEPEWFCEIDAFPSAVLAHHHPQVPNYGDFTQLLDPTHPARNGDPIDLLVGGTPCQSFSYAGVRAGLDDPRGQLMLKYLDLVGVLRPRWIVWENVPGVLSSGGGRDFGSLLGGMADLGYGVAYRVLDARHFGVPQRRRRVFVVGHSGGDPERAARVLALDEGVRGHSAARGNSRKEAAAAIGGGSAVGGELVTASMGTMGGNDGVYADGTVATLRVEAQPNVAFLRECGAGYFVEDSVAGTLDATSAKHTERAATVFQLPVGVDIYNHTITGDVSVTTLRVEAQPAVAISVGIPDPAYCVAGRSFGRDSQDTYVVAFARNTRDEVRLIGGDGNIAGCINAESGTHQTTYILVKDVAQAANGSYNGSSPMALVATGDRGHDVSPPLSADADKGDQDTLIVQPVAICEGAHGVTEMPITTALQGTGGKLGQGQQGVRLGDVVRRLTPRECERLQGFPDDWTAIPYKGKLATDGHRYKALGNSMAVPVMRWIGERIEKEDKQ